MVKVSFSHGHLKLHINKWRKKNEEYSRNKTFFSWIRFRFRRFWFSFTSTSTHQKTKPNRIYYIYICVIRTNIIFSCLFFFLFVFLEFFFSFSLLTHKSYQVMGKKKKKHPKEWHWYVSFKTKRNTFFSY
jgi:hypothetical protein